MELRPLGTTDVEVTKICLGTMTWGQQNDEAEAFAQMDAALDHGVNFLDAAEMYPVPPSAESQGRTEAYIGNWLHARGTRDRVVLATKVTGRSRGFPYLRPDIDDGETRLDRASIEAALEASLRRLRTDHIDLYQLHWPDRAVNLFGQRGYVHDPEDEAVALEETLAVLADAIQAGKVRHVGLSNDTPWGVMRCLALAETRGLPRMVSIQNAYNLVNRSFETGLAEIAMRERIGLLAYSPLAGGTLTGKYLDGRKPAGARMTLFGERYPRYFTPPAKPAIRAYVDLARAHGFDPAQMAVAFAASRPFVTSAIIGATSLAQLETNLAAAALTLSPEVMDGIEAIQRLYPDPCP